MMVRRLTRRRWRLLLAGAVALCAIPATAPSAHAYNGWVSRITVTNARMRVHDDRVINALNKTCNYVMPTRQGLSDTPGPSGVPNGAFRTVLDYTSPNCNDGVDYAWGTVWVGHRWYILDYVDFQTDVVELTVTLQVANPVGRRSVVVPVTPGWNGSHTMRVENSGLGQDWAEVTFDYSHSFVRG